MSVSLDVFLRWISGSDYMTFFMALVHIDKCIPKRMPIYVLCGLFDKRWEHLSLRSQIPSESSYVGFLSPLLWEACPLF